MYKRKKSPKKSVGAVRKSRRSAGRIKKVLIFLSAIALFGLAAFGFSKLSAVFFALGGPSWAHWRLGEIKITGGTPDSRYEVFKRIGFEAGDIITARDAANLETTLKAGLKQLAAVQVSRNFFNKQLTVKIKKQTPQARIITGGKTLYLAPGGVLFSDAEINDGDGTLLPIYFKDKTKADFLPQELVKLINELKAAKNLPLNAAEIDAEDKTFSLNIGGDISADMGGWAQGGRKISALSKLIENARAKNLKPPYDINFNYFEYGKIYLKVAK